MTCMRRIASNYVGMQDCKRKRESGLTPSEEKSKKLQGNKREDMGNMFIRLALADCSCRYDNREVKLPYLEERRFGMQKRRLRIMRSCIYGSSVTSPVASMLVKASELC
jgi:hypothetical protein